MICDWVKHMYFEAFWKLCRPILGISPEIIEKQNAGGILFHLLTGDHSQLIAEHFFRPMFGSSILKVQLFIIIIIIIIIHMI